jgi:putative ABC transport system ATP-binding protein
MVLVATKNVCKYFRPSDTREVRAIDDVSLSIPRGSFAVLCGPSGSGKSTLLSLLGGLARPTSGQLFFGEREAASYSDAEMARQRRRMGFVFQDFGLLPRLGLLDNITYPLIPQGYSRAERRTIGLRLLDQLQLSPQALQRPDELSGGERQRVAVARALAGNPEAVLADEPTSNLDQETSHRVSDLFQQMHADGKTVIIASHDPDILSRATCVFRLQKGKIVAPS